MMEPKPWITCFALFIILNFYLATAQPWDYPAANLSTVWTNNVSAPHSVSFTDGSTVRSILLRGTFGPRFACGFYCNGNCTTYLFAVFIVQTNSVSHIVLPAIGFPQVVWSANRDFPVRLGATLNLTAAGELVLQDGDGSAVWTANTTGKSVVGMNLTDAGNLVLFDVNRSVVWQSFDYPTDSLVPGQRLFQGKQLIPSVSSTNWTTQKDLYSLQVIAKSGLYAYVESNPPQLYYSNLVTDKNASIEKGYVRFLNGRLSLFIQSAEPSDPDGVISIPQASSAQFMKLIPDGHLKVFEWQSGWTEVADVFSHSLEDCDYPLACGRNGVCSDNQQCSCPVSSSPRIDYFRALNDRQPNLGCAELTPLTCNATQDQFFIELENVKYFTDFTFKDMETVDMETCKQACLNNCSCKAALFRYGLNSSNGDCYLPSDLFTMRNVDPNIIHFNASAFVKVQNVTSPTSFIHLDIKPQNILLDKDFNAKVSDFGLSKLIDRNETEVMTTMRGTPGYLAPEWLRSVITEKVDVYSFGIVLLEILCGRKNFDRSQPEESWHILGVFQRCWEQEALLDIVDKYSEDMLTHDAEVVEMMKVASWCLQTDYTKRPSMSTVIKVLDGMLKVESNLDYNFTDPRLQKTAVEHEKDFTPLLPSVLSGPR